MQILHLVILQFWFAVILLIETRGTVCGSLNLNFAYSSVFNAIPHERKLLCSALFFLRRREKSLRTHQRQRYAPEIKGQRESGSFELARIELRDAVGNFARYIAKVWSSHPEPLLPGNPISGMFVEVSEKSVYVLVHAPNSTASSAAAAGKGSDLFWKVHCAGSRADIGHAALLLHLRRHSALTVGGSAVESIGLVSGLVDVEGARTIK